MELFACDIPLIQFPTLPGICGLGMTDKECYAKLLEEKFQYTNTFYDHEPRIDFSQRHPSLAAKFDFILSADVFEHVAPPPIRAMNEVCNMLKPTGFLVATVPCTPSNQFVEHFPDLFDYRVVPLGGSFVLVNRRCDGTIEIREDVRFHEGLGQTLEMRQFGVTELRSQLIEAGFSELDFLTDNKPDIGILFDRDVSQPVIARKLHFQLDRLAQVQLVAEWQRAHHTLLEERARLDRLREQMQMASKSRWLRLGRRLGLGPILWDGN